jgi:hypothetical protein
LLEEVLFKVRVSRGRLGLRDGYRNVSRHLVEQLVSPQTLDRDPFPFRNTSPSSPWTNNLNRYSYLDTVPTASLVTPSPQFTHYPRVIPHSSEKNREYAGSWEWSGSVCNNTKHMGLASSVRFRFENSKIFSMLCIEKLCKNTIDL